MIPSREQLVEAYAFYARRVKLDERSSPLGIGGPAAARPAAIEAALAQATELVAQGHGEVAAALYAFSSHPRCFPGALLAFTTLLAKEIAASRRLRLVASRDEFRDVIMGVAQKALTPDRVAHWVELHTTEIS